MPALSGGRIVANCGSLRAMDHAVSWDSHAISIVPLELKPGNAAAASARVQDRDRPVLCLDALSLREPVSVSLENAFGRHTFLFLPCTRCFRGPRRAAAAFRVAWAWPATLDPPGFPAARRWSLPRIPPALTAISLAMPSRRRTVAAVCSA